MNPKSRTALVLAAVAGVALIIAAPIYLRESEQGHTDGGLRPDPMAVPEGWRAESYAGVQLSVPNSFGWDSSPRKASTLWCGEDQATVAPGRARPPKPGTAYVGRPIPTTDACRTFKVTSPPAPRASSVWFASPLPVGVQKLANGWTRHTVRVGDTHVTVTTDDADLAKRVLATAGTVDRDANGCATEPAARLPARAPDSLRPQSLSVCAYEGSTLVWSTRKDAAAATRFEHAFSASSALFDAAEQCHHTARGEWVALGVNGVQDTRWYTAELDCGQLLSEYAAVDGPARSAAGLTPQTVSPWAGDGLRAYLVGPRVPGLERYFRGMLG